MIVIRITIYWTWTFYQTLMPCVIYLTSVLNNLKIRLLFYLSYVDEGSSEAWVEGVGESLSEIKVVL